MWLLLLTSSIVSSFLLFSYHPMMIMLMVIAQTLVLCLIIWLKMITSWFSFILFLIFIGGVMVLFVYITSLAANEMFYFSLSWVSQQTYMMTSLIAFMTLVTFFSMNYSQSPGTLFSSVSLMFDYSNLAIIIMIMTYLLVTLIVAVKIANKTEGPLRNLMMSN